MSPDGPIHAVNFGESEAMILERRILLCRDLMRHAMNAYERGELPLCATLLGRLEITALCAQRSAEKLSQQNP